MKAARSILLAAVAMVLFAGCAFFVYYTARLIYVNLTVAGVAQHRQAGMYIGAVAFPVIALALGYLGLRCVKASRRKTA